MKCLIFSFLSSLKSAFHSRSEHRQLHSKFEKSFALNSSPYHHTPFCTIFCHLYRSQWEGEENPFFFGSHPLVTGCYWLASTGWGAACLPVVPSVTEEQKAMFRVRPSWSKYVGLLTSHHSGWQRNWALSLTTWNLKWTLAGRLLRKENWIFRLFLIPGAWLHFSSSDHDSFVCQFAVFPVVSGDLWSESAMLIHLLLSSSDHCGKLHLCESWLHLLWLRWWHRADF